MYSPSDDEILEYLHGSYSCLLCWEVPREDAEDLALEAVLSFLKALETKAIDAKARRTYLYKVTYNRLIDWYRRTKPKKWREVALDHFDQLAKFAIPDREVRAIDVSDLVRDLLECLTRRQRQVIALRYLQDLDLEETASVLGISVKAVDSACRRALETMKARLDRLDRDDK